MADTKARRLVVFGRGAVLVAYLAAFALACLVDYTVEAGRAWGREAVVAWRGWRRDLRGY